MYNTATQTNYLHLLSLGRAPSIQLRGELHKSRDRTREKLHNLRAMNPSAGHWYVVLTIYLFVGELR